MSIIGFLKGYTLPNDGYVVTEVTAGVPPATGSAAAVIFRPGAPSSGYFLATWAEVAAAIATAEGCITVYVDSSIAPANVPAGVYECFGRVVILGPDDNFFGGPTVLTIDDGAQLRNLRGIDGSLNLECDTQGALPALDWDYSAAPYHSAGFIVQNGASILNTPTATAPSVIVLAGMVLDIALLNANFFLGALAVPFLHTAGATAGVILSAFDSYVQSNLCDGLGTFDMIYDSNTLTYSQALPPVSAATPTFQQVDTHTVVLDFIANAANVLAALQAAGALPTTGNATVFASGFGGGSSGSGGATGALGAGDGGTGGNGAWWSQSESLQIDLSQPLDVVIGTGGPSVPADTVAADAGSTMVTGNGGQTLLTFAGAHVLEGAGIASFGGVGGTAGNPGAGGQHNFLASQGEAPIGPPGGLWSGGAGGAGNAGGGGGGGGAGPRGSAIGGATGGAGGAGGTAGNPGSPGTDATANTGASGGGGGGGDAGQAGGVSGAGASGWLRLTVVAP